MFIYQKVIQILLTLNSEKEAYIYIYHKHMYSYIYHKRFKFEQKLISILTYFDSFLQLSLASPCNAMK